MKVEKTMSEEDVKDLFKRHLRNLEEYYLETAGEKFGERLVDLAEEYKRRYGEDYFRVQQEVKHWE